MLVAFLLSLAIIFPCILVLLNKKTQYQELLFLGLSFSLATWVFTNYLVDQDITNSLLWTRATFFSVIWACFFFFEFTLNFPDRVKFNWLVRKIILLLTLVLSVLTFTDLFVVSVNVSGAVVEFTPGVLYTLFLIYYPVVLLLSFLILIRSLRKTHGVKRERAKTVLVAIVSMTIITSTTNLILPEFFKYTNLAPFGGYATVIFTIGVAYAMLRHHLFDIRGAVARATAYVLAVGLIIATYSALTTIVTNLITARTNSDFLQRVVYAIFTALVAISYGPIKKFFDRVTNNLFFRDAYDPQTLLDSLSEQLVGTIDLEQLISGATTLINTSFKSAYCIVILIDPKTGKPRVLGSGVKKLNNQALVSLVSAMKNHENWPLIAQEVEGQQLRTILHLARASIVIEMTTKTEQLGFIVMGEKKNGNIYNGQDGAVLSIIADQLALGLENALRFEQIEDFSMNLQHKIDAATRELTRTNTKLKALDEAKDEFISMASHQLRTPLTSIKGYLSMVLEGDAGKVSKDQEKMLSQAFISAQRMVYLIADLLNVSRLQTGKFIIEPKEVYLPDVVREELAQLTETAKAKRITFNYTMPDTFPTLRLDETKIRQVIMNFADNALYYTPAGGHAEVVLKETKSSVELTITDSGMGVPKSDQHKLFSKFYRAENARKARPDGTGLGLFMAQKVIIASGGSIIFRSQEGKGSTFGFTFPKQQD